MYTFTSYLQLNGCLAVMFPWINGCAEILKYIFCVHSEGRRDMLPLTIIKRRRKTRYPSKKAIFSTSFRAKNATKNGSTDTWLAARRLVWFLREFWTRNTMKTTSWTVRAEISNFQHFTFDFFKFKMSKCKCQILLIYPYTSPALPSH